MNPVRVVSIHVVGHVGSGMARFITVLGFAERNAQPAFFSS
jgi:hypothetical protein